MEIVMLLTFKNITFTFIIKSKTLKLPTIVAEKLGRWETADVCDSKIIKSHKIKMFRI